MSKITRLSIENFMRIRSVEVVPNSGLNVVGGRNGQGKTSFMNAIASLCGGADELPEMPVKQGEEFARVIGEFDGCVVTERISKEGSRTLIIKNKEGWPVSKPQEMLNKVTSKRMFDPLSFVKEEPQKQASTLRKLTGLDFSKHDAERKALYDSRTIQNREAARLKSVVASLPVLDAPDKEMLTSDIVAEMDKARDHNLSLQSANQEIVNKDNIISKLVSEMSDKEKELIKLQNEQEERKIKLLTMAPAIDIAPLKTKLDDLDKTNTNVRKKKERTKAVYAANSAEEISQEMTQKIDAMDASKTEAVKATKFPVDGLSFDGDTVLFDSLPFSQTSSAKQIRVSLAIAAALNPELRMCIIRDGEKLDDEGMQLIAQLAQELDLQIFLERVGKGEECQIVIEDGSVLGQEVKS